jgi:hypothetical protein
MSILSITEIDNICKQVVKSSEPYDIFLFAFFDTLYKTGLRSGEVLDFTRWSMISNDHLQVQTLKGSNPRTFKTEELNPIFVDLIRYDSTHIARYNYKSLQRSFNRFAPFSQLLNGINKYQHIYSDTTKQNN